MRNDRLRPAVALGAFVGTAALLWISAVGAQPAPGWSRWQRELPISQAECLSRAVDGAAKLKLRVDFQNQASLVAIEPQHTVLIECVPLGEQRTWVISLIASNGGGSRNLNNFVSAALMREPPKIGGFGPDDEPDIPAPVGALVPPMCRGTAWDYAPGDEHRGKIGQRFQHLCPANGCNNGRIAGTGEYTDDSSVCLAAVHSGLITFRDGGTVTYEITRDMQDYPGSSRYGVTSLNVPDYNGAFKFPPR